MQCWSHLRSTKSDSTGYTCSIILTYSEMPSKSYTISLLLAPPYIIDGAILKNGHMIARIAVVQSSHFPLLHRSASQQTSSRRDGRVFRGKTEWLSPHRQCSELCQQHDARSQWLLSGIVYPLRPSWSELYRSSVLWNPQHRCRCAAILVRLPVNGRD